MRGGAGAWSSSQNSLHRVRDVVAVSDGVLVDIGKSLELARDAAVKCPTQGLSDGAVHDIPRSHGYVLQLRDGKESPEQAILCLQIYGIVFQSQQFEIETAVGRLTRVHNSYVYEK